MSKKQFLSQRWVKNTLRCCEKEERLLVSISLWRAYLQGQQYMRDKCLKIVKGV